MRTMSDERGRLKAHLSLSFLMLGTVAAVWVWSHEGHQPLPTRGVQVDLDKGLVTVSGDSRKVLDVQTQIVRSPTCLACG